MRIGENFTVQPDPFLTDEPPGLALAGGQSDAHQHFHDRRATLEARLRYLLRQVPLLEHPLEGLLGFTGGVLPMENGHNLAC